MAINFNSLPQSKPNGAVTGAFYATILKAEMRKSTTNPSNPEYLSLEVQLSNQNGASVGKLYDIISEPTKDFTKYKLYRFLHALGIQLEGDFELKDIAKICPGKRYIVDVKPDDKGYNSVDVFKNEIYYPVSEAAIAFGQDVVTAEDPFSAIEDDMPITLEADAGPIAASDATDY